MREPECDLARLSDFSLARLWDDILANRPLPLPEDGRDAGDSLAVITERLLRAHGWTPPPEWETDPTHIAYRRIAENAKRR